MLFMFLIILIIAKKMSHKNLYEKGKYQMSENTQEKFTIEDLIVQKIIFAGTYTQAQAIAKELHNYNIKTDVIDHMITIRDPIFYMLIDHGELTMILPDSVKLFEESYLIIDCSCIDVEYPTLDKEETKEFQLEEIVHVIINENSLIDNIVSLCNSNHVTAYISAIDKENKMCEIVYLHNVHMAKWVSFNDVYHIEHIYNNAECEEQIEDEE